MRQGATERRERIVRGLRAWIADHGQGPWVRRLGALVGLSGTSLVACHLGRLEEEGLISRSGRRRRSVRLGR
ncbi:hypothetical protein [Streptomyces sp. NPDC058394]|uniref:LexA family protein n=1 Tax=unclassified Streptomyces TaxID=2593676 RepID=UPI00365C6614